MIIWQNREKWVNQIRSPNRWENLKPKDTRWSRCRWHQKNHYDLFFFLILLAAVLTSWWDITNAVNGDSWFAKRRGAIGLVNSNFNVCELLLWGLRQCHGAWKKTRRMVDTVPTLGLRKVDTLVTSQSQLGLYTNMYRRSIVEIPFVCNIPYYLIPTCLCSSAWVILMETLAGLSILSLVSWRYTSVLRVESPRILLLLFFF